MYGFVVRSNEKGREDNVEGGKWEKMCRLEVNEGNGEGGKDEKGRRRIDINVYGFKT